MLRYLIRYSFIEVSLPCNGTFLLQPIQPSLANIDCSIGVSVMQGVAVNARPLPYLQAILAFRARSQMTDGALLRGLALIDLFERMLPHSPS